MGLTEVLKQYAGESEPMRELPADRVSWPEIWQEMFEERAARLEFDNEMNRQMAEAMAERETRKKYKAGSWYGRP